MKRAFDFIGVCKHDLLLARGMLPSFEIKVQPFEQIIEKCQPDWNVQPIVDHAEVLRHDAFLIVRQTGMWCEGNGDELVPDGVFISTRFGLRCVASLKKAG